MEITKGSKVLFNVGTLTLVGEYVKTIKNGEETDSGETNDSEQDLFVINTDGQVFMEMLVFEDEIIKTEDEINEMTLEDLSSVELSAEKQRLVNEKFNDENVTDEDYIEFLREKVKETFFTM